MQRQSIRKQFNSFIIRLMGNLNVTKIKPSNCLANWLAEVRKFTVLWWKKYAAKQATTKMQAAKSVKFMTVSIS